MFICASRKYTQKAIQFSVDPKAFGIENIYIYATTRIVIPAIYMMSHCEEPNRYIARREEWSHVRRCGLWQSIIALRFIHRAHAVFGFEALNHAWFVVDNQHKRRITVNIDPGRSTNPNCRGKRCVFSFSRSRGCSAHVNCVASHLGAHNVALFADGEFIWSALARSGTHQFAWLLERLGILCYVFSSELVLAKHLDTYWNLNLLHLVTLFRINIKNSMNSAD